MKKFYFLLMLLGLSTWGWGQTPYVMSGGDYSENFADIANWTDNFNAGTGADRWGSVAINASGTIPDGIKTTKSSATWVTGTSGGIQKGTQAMMFLSTGSSAATQSVAADLFLDFTGRTAGTLSFDWTAIDNGSGSRPTSLRVYWSINGTSFTEISAAQVLEKVSPNTSSITTVALPTEFNNVSTARIRFYNYAGTATGSGNRDKMQIDNIAVTSTAASCTDPTTQASNVTFSSILSDQMTVNWTRGGTPGDGVIVVAKAGSAPDDPTDGTAYTANATFGSGTPINTNTFVVYMGSGTNINVTGLSGSTSYYYKVYEKNCTGTSIMINTSSPAAGNQATTAACAENPTIATTIAANTILPTTASSGGQTITSGANCAITAKGVCWKTSTGPTIADSKTTNGTGTEDFTSSLTSLSAQTLYYVRAYATNSFGTGYGPEITFRTLSTEPSAHPGTFSATAATSSQINLSFSAASSISNADGYIILRRTGSNPTSTNITDGVAPASLTMPSGTTFITDINSTATTTYNNTGLPNPNTQYNYAIIAYNWDGVNPETYNYYTGGTIKVANATTLATAVTLPYSQDFEGTTTEWVLATSGTNKWAIGSATNNGGAKALYISNNSGTSNAYTITSSQSSGTDATVRVDLTGQTSASLSFDWKSYGEVTSGTVYDYGEVYINTGGSDILISSTKEFVNTTTFATKNISLTPYIGGVVFIKFRWVNDDTEGNQPPFAVDNISITAGDYPTLITTAISSITISGASSGGNITNDGGSSITARGVCYGTSSNPTIAGTKTEDGTGTGSFTSTLTGLTDNTLYYVRAYATNSTGTSYGNEISFTTSSVSAPVATDADNISSTGFSANWAASAGAASYKLDVSTSSTFGTESPATLTEGFETGLSTSGYVTGDRVLSSGTWSFVESGLAATGSGNFYSGSTSCQLKANTGSATTPALNNVGTLSFYAKSPSGSSTFTIKKKVNGVTTTVTTKSITTSWAQYSVDINDNSSSVQIIIASGASYAYIDDVSISYITFTPSFVAGYGDLEVNGTSEGVTGLEPNTTYYYRVRAVGGNSTSANSNTITVATNASNSSTYTGTGNWTNAGNWSAGIPGASTNVTINGSVTVDDHVECDDITISTTGAVTVGTGNGLLVHGNFLIQSDVTGTGSFIGASADYDIEGTTVVERYISPYSSSSNGWHFISSPVNSMAIAGSDFVTGTYDLYRWAEVETVNPESWYNYEDVDNTFAHAQFENGLGYLFAHSVGGVFEFIGDLNEDVSYEKTLTYTVAGGDGWNLIGNPYPSGLNWNVLDRNLNISGSFYIVNPENGSYKSSNGALISDFPNGFIPPHQGFFVQVTTATTIGMTTSDQVHTTNNFEKSSDSFDEILSVDLVGSNSSNKTYFQFRDDATQEFDFHADAYKLYGWATIPQVYSKLNGVEYSINCLPHSEETITVPLGVSTQTNEQLTFNFAGMETFYTTIKIELEDKTSGVTQNIKENPIYTFLATPQDGANRFLLHFNGVTAVEGLEASQTKVYSVDNTLYVSSLSNLDAHILVYNVNGQLVAQEQMNGESLKKIDFQAAAGIYLVSIQTEGSLETQKVYVK